MRTKVLYMLALLLVLSVGQADAQRILPRMQGVEMRGGMASDNGYYMGMTLSSYAKGGNKWVYGAEYLHMKHGYRHVTIPSAQFTAEGGYYLNFLSDAGKVFFLNLDGRFTLLPTCCLGNCDKGPNMMIDEDTHAHLTPEAIPELLERYK